MAINSITGIKSGELLPSSQAKDKTSESTGETVGSSRQDQIDITKFAGDIAKALSADSLTQAIDEQKVAAVKEALREGNYHINADNIAEKILQFEPDSDSG